MEINRIQSVTGRQPQFSQSGSQEASEEKKEIVDEEALEQSPMTEKRVANTVEGLNRMFESTHIQFTYHEESGKYYVRIIDDNDEVIKEIPSKKILDMVTEMGKALGLIIDKKV